MHLAQRQIGCLPGGKAVMLYEITNETGAILRLTNLGAQVLSLHLPDRHGKLEDVVLGYPNWEDYLASARNMAGVGGRYSGRIANARFSLNGQEYTLAANNGPNHLHGGLNPFHTKLWIPVVVTGTDEEVSVGLAYMSVDGEEGYPGNLYVTVTYSFNEAGEVKMHYTARTDKETVANLMNHWYLNMSGHGSGSINLQHVQVNAKHFAELGEGLIPTGRLLEVEGTPLDLNEPVPFGVRANSESPLIALIGGLDHSFLLPKPWKLGIIRASVYDPHSGRFVEVETDQPSVHVFTANENMNGIHGKEGVIYGKRPGFCLETQHLPNSPNIRQFPPTNILPGKPFATTTIYRFGVRA